MVNTRICAAVAVALFTAGSMPAADPQLTALVMPGAKVLAGVNVEQAKTTPFGQYVIGRVEQNDEALRRLMEATGFDPRRDIAEVLLASTGQPAGSHPPGLALVRGTFDVATISEAARANGGEVETRDGGTILSGPARRGAVAILNSSIAIAGQEADVLAALDRISTPTLLDPALAVQVNRLSTTHDAWVVSLVAPPIKGLPVNTIESTTLGIKFGANVDLSGEALTTTDQNADTLAATIRMFAAIAGANSRSSAAALLQGLNVTADARTVRLSLSIPEAQVEALFPARTTRPGVGRRGNGGPREGETTGWPGIREIRRPRPALRPVPPV